MALEAARPPCPFRQLKDELQMPAASGADCGDWLKTGIDHSPP